MFKEILLSLLLINIVLSHETTHDPEFEKKFQLTHIKEGDGKTFPKKGEKLHVHYTGTFLDGKQFDSSYDRDRPFRFIVGVGAVIQCWDIVVLRLSLGEKVKVICPYDLAYGEKGFAAIPPKADIAFEIELIKIEPQEDL